MADGKLDLPDDLISSSKVAAEHPPLIAKVEADDDKLFADDSKGDQSAPDSSIPLSPQWLYSKPSDPKMMFPATATATATSDSNLKDPWRLDASDKKDKRRSAPLDSTSSDGARRWREEERETTLLSSATVRRDRRKPDRRPDNPSSVREPLPPSERWADGSNRNAALEPRRDNSKWSSRWGPDDKERDSRSDKRTDLLDKDDLQNDNQTATLNNNNSRAPADRDSDARDKWRPRHRMEVNSTGPSPSSHRAAPGFGPDKGIVKGPTMGFTVGRGKATYGGGRGSSIGAVQLDKNETVPGKPNSPTATFSYPRGKLLDIYRKHKFDSSFTSMPDYLEDVSSIAQVDVLEPLAFVVPVGEEEVILKDIGIGKITGSEVAYNSLRKVQYESIADTDNFESNNGANNNPPSMISSDSIDAVGGVANDDDDEYQLDEDSRTISIGRSSNHEKGGSSESEKLSLKLPADMIFNNSEISGSRYTSGTMSVDENGQLAGYDVTKHPKFDEGHPDALIDRSTKLPNDSDSQLLPTEQYARSNLQMLEINGDVNRQELDIPFEELSLYYRDPQGEIQGPFLWDDIISWLEQRFFGTDLPVRFADAQDGTPFLPLGHVISSLKVRGDGFSSGMDPSSMPDEFRVLGAQSDASLSAPGQLPGVTDSSMLSYPCLPLSTGFDSIHAQSRISENEGPQQLPRSEGQSFHDNTLDEEIVFPGRPGSAGYQIGNYPRNNKDPLSNSISHHSRLNEFSEPVMPNLNDSEMHPFGLLRSELEGGHPGHAQSANISLRRTFGPTADETRVTDTWPEVYKENTVSKSGMHQDALGARHASLLEQESTHFDMAEQLMSQQVQQQLMQQQLQQRNVLTSHLHLNEPFVDQLPSRNHGQHQQLPNHQVQDIEHLYMLHLQEQRQQQLQEQRQLQLQEQRQLQLQEQRQLQLQQQQLQQQQQFHQQKLILQEQQQSQARQVLLEQLLHNQMHETILGQTRGDPSRTNKVLDQILSNQHLLHELQQRPHHPPRHGDSSLDQLIQAKFSSPQHQNDLYELMSRAQHSQIRSLEQQIRQQEQLQARQLPMGLRQRMDMEEERNIGAAWPIGGEANQFSRTNPAAHHLAGNPLDLYQLQQRIAQEEQLTHLERNLSLQDRIQLERSMSLPPGANRDAVHAFAHAQILDRQDSNAHMHSASQMNSGFHSHHSPPLPNQYSASHLDTIDGQWPDNNGRISNDWMDSHIQQSQLNSERQKREAHGKMVSEDPSLWMSESINDEKSKRLLMDLLHQKPGHQSTDVLNANSGMAYERRNQSFSSLPDQEVGFYPAGSSGFNLGAQPHTYISNEQTLQHSEMLQRSNSGVAIQEEPLINQTTSSNTSKFNKSSMEREITEPDGKKYGFKSDAKPKGPTVDVQERMAEQQRFAAVDHREISSNNSNNSKIASRGLSGIFNENGAHTDLVAGDNIGKERVPSLLSRGQDNILLRRPPAHRASASQEGLSELASELTTRGKVVSNAGPSDGSVASQSSDGKKDVRFRRSSSYNDADVAETTSFIDKLKSSNSKKSGAAAASSESSPSETTAEGGTHGGKSGGKKKGKKGRQIDPALLGFKVTSNRIMMGEIQRLDD